MRASTDFSATDTWILHPPARRRKIEKRALAAELGAGGLRVRPQVPIVVRYKGQAVGDYLADLVVEDAVIVEIKAQRVLHATNSAQLLNYLAASGLRVGYLVNFHYPKATVRRLIL
ncbi:MAG: GxxExxY protein [Rhodospirillaceae bacterium]|nr:GxxExxY protein [Rhodospirillaceae bacterium]